MRTILVLCGVLLAAVVAWLGIARPWAAHHGSAFRGFPSVTLQQLVDHPSEHLKKDVRIEGVVTRMCPHCACWLFVKDAEGRELRVDAGETAEQIPYCPGKVATVEGQLIKFGDGYEFVGTAVRIH